MEELSSLPDDVVELGRGLIGSPAFLIGCARSGTSILGEAIAAHPRVAYLFEASRIWNSLVPDKPDHRLVAADAEPTTAKAIYEALARERRELSGDVLLEKNPKHVIRIPFLHALFPEARFLHIVRDARDTVASLMFRNRGENWGHLEIPGWRELLKQHPEDNHIRCAHQWLYAVTTARSDAAKLPHGRYVEVRYEDLVRDPKPIVRRVLGFLDLDLSPDVEDFLDRIQDETRGSYHAKKQVRHYVENHSHRIGRYRENLTERQIRDVVGICGDTPENDE